MRVDAEISIQDLDTNKYLQNSGLRKAAGVQDYIKNIDILSINDVGMSATPGANGYPSVQNHNQKVMSPSSEERLKRRMRFAKHERRSQEQPDISSSVSKYQELNDFASGVTASLGNGEIFGPEKGTSKDESEQHDKEAKSLEKTKDFSKPQRIPKPAKRSPKPGSKERKSKRKFPKSNFNSGEQMGHLTFREDACQRLSSMRADDNYSRKDPLQYHPGSSNYISANSANSRMSTQPIQKHSSKSSKKSGQRTPVLGGTLTRKTTLNAISNSDHSKNYSSVRIEPTEGSTKPLLLSASHAFPGANPPPRSPGLAETQSILGERDPRTSKRNPYDIKPTQNLNKQSQHHSSYRGKGIEGRLPPEPSGNASLLAAIAKLQALTNKQAQSTRLKSPSPSRGFPFLPKPKTSSHCLPEPIRVDVLNKGHNLRCLVRSVEEISRKVRTRSTVSVTGVTGDTVKISTIARQRRPASLGSRSRGTSLPSQYYSAPKC